MDVLLKYRGRVIQAQDAAFIQSLIDAHPTASRRALSSILCEAWDWRQPNGQLRDMVCRSLMLELHRAGHIELPPVRCRPRNNVVERRKPVAIAVDAQPLRTSLSERLPLEIRQVRGTPQEPLCNALVEAHHYLGYTQPVGEHLKYLVWSKERPIACVAWSSAPRHLGPRDRFIGWSAEARRRNIGFLAYNSRFLVLPWVEVPNLASHLLGRLARMLPRDWERIYGHPLYYLETFVDPGRFRGTCYQAANWVCLGLTTGRGKDARSKKPNRPRKEILGYPLNRRFRPLLCGLV
ncbi:MAG: DUF4338 domain-containing protein [Alphaproteobacteria bacterium]|nr:DUF4338 domain-containing protein [Alphaproteobacteria bacterium]